MSTIPRVSSGVAGEPAHFGSVLAHQPEIAESFFALYGHFWGSDVLAARIKEVARMRNARVTECGFCRNVRFEKAVGQGLGEEVVDDITDGYETSAKLTDAEKTALQNWAKEQQAALEAPPPAPDEAAPEAAVDAGSTP